MLITVKIYEVEISESCLRLWHQSEIISLLCSTTMMSCLKPLHVDCTFHPYTSKGGEMHLKPPTRNNVIRHPHFLSSLCYLLIELMQEMRNRGVQSGGELLQPLV